MLFDPSDPFPLAPVGPQTYGDAKLHAAACDAWLGLRVEEVEASLRAAPAPADGQERWTAFPSHVFLTPYSELRFWLEQVRPAPGETVADLGAGYGRLGFVLARHFPESRFHGVELVAERAAEGRAALERFGARNALLEVGDLASTDQAFPQASIYFIYDFGSRRAIAWALARLQEVSRSHTIRVVARGRGVRDAVEREHPWLGEVCQPEHFAHFSVYSSG